MFVILLSNSQSGIILIGFFSDISASPFVNCAIWLFQHQSLSATVVINACSLELQVVSMFLFRKDVTFVWIAYTELCRSVLCDPAFMPISAFASVYASVWSVKWSTHVLQNWC